MSVRIAAIDVLVLACLWWCISFFIVNPFGNFPLNDDWSYGLTVKHLMETGDFRPTGWTSMPLITHVLWGLFFCIPYGFSFMALRLSTLTLSLFGIIGLYFLIRNMRQPRWLAIVISLTLGFNPIYYVLSYTFMTDVPFTAIAVLAAVFLVRNLITDSNFDLFIGTAMAVAATLLRQLAISVPLAFAVASILMYGFKNRNMLRAAIVLVLCVGTLLAFQKWLAVSGRLPALYHIKANELLDILHGNPKTLILSLARHTYVGLLYLGLFLLPVLIFAIAGFLRSHRKQTIALLIVAMVILRIGALVVFGRTPMLMPMASNVLIQSGVGPLTLHDTYILGLNHVPALPMNFWFTVTVFSILGAWFLLTILGVSIIHLASKLQRGGKISHHEAAGVFFLLTAVIYLLPCFVGGFFDRYLIPTIPFLAAAIAGFSGQFPNIRILRFAVVMFLVIFSFFAIGSTRDYLMWNRVRWKALHDLMENNPVSAEDIDGGFEFNGLYLYDPDYQQNPGKSWWWVHGDTYQIGFSDIPNYKVIEEYSYFNWIPPRVGKVVVLKKNFPLFPKSEEMTGQS